MLTIDQPLKVKQANERYMLSEIPEIIKKEAKEDKDYILGEIFPYKEIRHNSYSNSDFDCGGMTPWEEQMCDVIDYGDLC